MNRRFIIAATLAIGSTLLVAGIVNSVRGPESKTGPEGQFEGEIRWANVSLIIPPGSPVRVLRNPPFTADHGYELRLYVDDGDEPVLEVVIDAETGEVVSDTLSAKYPNEVAGIVSSMSVASADRGQWELPNVWPFVDGQIPDERFDIGRISVVMPDPASGVMVASVEPNCDRSSPTCYDRLLLVVFGESRAHVDAATGNVVASDRIAPEHRGAFDRYFASIVMRTELPASE